VPLSRWGDAQLWGIPADFNVSSPMPPQRESGPRQDDPVTYLVTVVKVGGTAIAGKAWAYEEADDSAVRRLITKIKKRSISETGPKVYIERYSRACRAQRGRPVAEAGEQTDTGETAEEPTSTGKATEEQTSTGREVVTAFGMGNEGAKKHPPKSAVRKRNQLPVTEQAAGAKSGLPEQSHRPPFKRARLSCSLTNIGCQYKECRVRGRCLAPTASVDSARTSTLAAAD
jgi:hypothetical protein